MTWRNTVSDAAGVDVSVDPPWLLAPLFLRDFFRLQVTGPGPGPLADQPPAERLVDPWLMHSVRPDRTVMLTAAAADWPAWWEQAVDYRPGGPAPRVADLVAFSPALSDSWPQVVNWFDKWLGRRRPTDPGPSVEHAMLDDFDRRYGRPPAHRSMRVLVIPVIGSLFIRPEPDRLVVSVGLRRDVSRYRDLLDPVLVDFF
ncbi:hypothetical protein [Nakamurella sp. PAMC28650]|jgi:hypothetical protein|uniref:hypothetical protein n=1 Tax=Nakamurella sp. PAMC28650 TaxID=2762325 RepID=UPI00164D9EBB|nr:hypothetical protein [Nakamurella sp. PAMC28650]QNK80100.1 hypothetical protein H7F38_18005 [Nakamurella sp. PAMC28650]